jgi:hypothetical protein
MRSSFALTAVVVTLGSAASIPQTPLRNILDNTDKNEKYTYPTDFTREILPVSRWLVTLPERRCRRNMSVLEANVRWHRYHFIVIMTTGAMFRFTLD